MKTITHVEESIIENSLSAPLEPLQVDQVSRLAGRVAVGEDTAAGGGSRCRRRWTTGHTTAFDFLLNVAQTSLDVLPDKDGIT